LVGVGFRVGIAVYVLKQAEQIFDAVFFFNTEYYMSFFFFILVLFSLHIRTMELFTSSIMTLPADSFLGKGKISDH